MCTWIGGKTAAPDNDSTRFGTYRNAFDAHCADLLCEAHERRQDVKHVREHDGADWKVADFATHEQDRVRDVVRRVQTRAREERDVESIIACGVLAVKWTRRGAAERRGFCELAPLGLHLAQVRQERREDVLGRERRTEDVGRRELADRSRSDRTRLRGKQTQRCCVADASRAGCDCRRRGRPRCSVGQVVRERRRDEPVNDNREERLEKDRAAKALNERFQHCWRCETELEQVRELGALVCAHNVAQELVLHRESPQRRSKRRQQEHNRCDDVLDADRLGVRRRLEERRKYREHDAHVGLWKLRERRQEQPRRVEAVVPVARAVVVREVAIHERKLIREKLARRRTERGGVEQWVPSARWCVASLETRNGVVAIEDTRSSEALGRIWVNEREHSVLSIHSSSRVRECVRKRRPQNGE